MVEEQILEDLKRVQVYLDEEKFPILLSLKGPWLLEKILQKGETISKQIDVVVTIFSKDEKYSMEDVKSQIDKIDTHGYEIRLMHTMELKDFDFLFDMMWFDFHEGL